MGSGAVKTIVLLMVLVVLSFLVGAQVSDSMKGSLGAFAIIGVIVGGGLLLYMGPRAWQLLFFLPPFVEMIPFKLFSHAISSCSMAPYAVSFVVMVYWIVMWSLGRVRVRWRWAAILDIPFWIFVGLMAVAYIRYPVALNVMNLDYDAIGGEEVVVLFFVLFHYICMSIIPIEKQAFEKSLHWGFRLSILAMLLIIAKGMLLSRGPGANAGDGVTVTRFYLLYPLGSTLFFWMYSKYSVGHILTSVRCWAISLFGAASSLLTGQRQNMALLAAGIVFIAAAKREILVLITALLLGYVGLLYMGEMDMLSHMPGSAQRAISSVPGVKVDERVKKGGAGTMETRRRLWTYAMNPRTGVIKDYMWGDGFALSRAFIQRQGVAAMRGTGGGTDDMEGMTITRNFHNGAIHTISRIGYVGLAWCALLCIITWAVGIQVLRVWAHTETYPYIVLGLIHMPIMLLTYGYANYETETFLFALQSYLFLKLCYCVARESGQLRPLFMSQRYVPMMIQETEKNSGAVGTLAA